jgi:hypothetical protein
MSSALGFAMFEVTVFLCKVVQLKQYNLENGN